MMKKFLSSVLAAILLMVTLLTGVSFGSPVQGHSTDYIEGQLVVSLEEPFMDSSQSVDDILMEADSLTESGFTIADSLFGQDTGSFSVQSLDSDVRATAIEKMGLVYLVEYSVEDYKSIDSAKISLEKTLDNLGFHVRYVTENRKMYALETAPVQDVSPQDIHNNQRWHYEMIKVPQAWEITTGSSSVRIGVLDTGIDSNHPSLKNLVNTSLGSSFVGGTTNDGNGHGTHVAGTIASYGSVSGVMQNATLIPIRVLNDSGSGSLYGVQQGIVYAANVRAMSSICRWVAAVTIKGWMRPFKRLSAWAPSWWLPLAMTDSQKSLIRRLTAVRSRLVPCPRAERVQASPIMDQVLM